MKIDGSPKKMVPLTSDDKKKQLSIFDVANEYEQKNDFYAHEEAPVNEVKSDAKE